MSALNQSWVHISASKVVGSNLQRFLSTTSPAVLKADSDTTVETLEHMSWAILDMIGYIGPYSFHQVMM